MLGLHTAKRRKAALALATVGALMGLAISPAFAADVPTHAEAEANAVHIEGQLLAQLTTPVLDSGACTATYDRAAGQPAPSPTVTNDGVATPPGQCGDGLTLAGGGASIAYTQNAKANSDAQSGAVATVAEAHLPGLDRTLDLTGVTAGLGNSNTSTLLNGITHGVGSLLVALSPVIVPLNDALQQVLTGINGVATINVVAKGVRAECTADPSMASGKGTVDGIDIVITLGPAGPNQQTITVKIPVGTDRNSGLVASVPNITDQVVTNLLTSLGSNATLGGALNTLTTALRDQVWAALKTNLLDQLQPVFDALGNGLAPIVEGTVNEQTDGDGDKVTSGPDAATGTVTENDDNDPQITVQALDVKLFQGTPLEGIVRLGRVNCGKNTGESFNGGNPGLQFDKDADTDHGDAKFTLTVHNPNAAPATGVFVQDFYGKDIKAKDVKDVNASQGTFNKDTGRWDVGTLAPGATAKLTFKVDASKSDLDDGVKNAACVNQSTKPANIQKNDGFGKDTDGCDEAKAQKDKKDDSDSDSDGPKGVDSGLNDGGNLGPLAITGLLAASTLIGSAARQRLLLDR
ncbi:MAG: hypothetical protein ACJ71Z_00515 [Aeromicrobium sp.]